MARKIELLETTIDENGHPVSSEVVHPLTSADCVVMENGATLDKVMGDGIATPTVTHESASFQVGVGDSNIEVVDGDVAGMTLEGKSYHNILPKPTTLIMETDEKEFKINDKIDNSIVLNDNVAEIATIKGQTYVNVIQEESASEYVALGEELSGQSVTTTGKPEGYIKNVTLEGSTKYHDIDNDTVLDEFDETKNLELISVNNPKMYATGKNLFDVDNGSNLGKDYTKDGNSITCNATSSPVFGFEGLDSNKSYTIAFDYVNNIQNPNSSSLAYAFDDKKRQYSQTTSYNIKLKGNYLVGQTTREVCVLTNKDAIWVQGGAGTTFSNIQIEEGTRATSYEPYKGVTIEQSIDSIPLTSDMFEQGGIDASNNSVTNGMSYQQFPKEGTSTNKIKSKTIIPVKPNAKYKINFKGYAIMFDKNGGYVKIGSQSTLNFTSGVEFTIPSNVHYMVLCMKISDNSTITPSTLDSLNLTLQEVTDEIILRSIGDVKDTLNLTTGEYVQRVGEVVLDGSEEWSQNGNGSYGFYTTKQDSKPSSTIVCDKLKEITGWNNYSEKGIFRGGQAFGIVVTSNELTTCNVETFETWLSQNPIKVQYELATPIIKKVNLTNTTKLLSYTSTTHYDTIVPSNSLVPNIKIPSTINYNVAIKPSTQYTIRANTTSAMSVDLGGSTGTLSNGKVTLTTPSTLAHNSLKLGNGKAKEVMVIEGSEIKDNVPFFNGMKNVEMGGIKLVNIARWQKCSALVTANTNKTQFTYTSNGANAYHTIYFDSSLLKTNTVYTLFADITTNTSDASQPVKFQFGYASSNLLDVSRGFVGKIKQTITSANTTKDGLAIVFRPCSSGGQVVIQNPMIIEGDWTYLDEIPYIESEMIIEQPIIRSQGKNLFDVNETPSYITQNTSFSLNGNEITINSNGNTNYPRITYDINKNLLLGKTVFVSYTVVEKTSEKWVIQFAYKNTNGETMYANCRVGTPITFPKEVIGNIYLGIYSDNSSSTGTAHTLKINNIQIEEGSTATSYEPFKQHTLSSNRVIGYEENCYYAIGGGAKVPTDTINSVMADVEGLPIAYVTGGSSNYTFWDKDDVFISGKQYLDTSLSSYDKNGFITVPSNAKYMRFASGGETNAQPLYKVATVTGELPLRSLPNGVCDTLNLVTGEYVQRVGEAVLNGSEDWEAAVDANSVYIRFQSVHLMKTMKKDNAYIHGDRFFNGKNKNTEEFIKIGDGNNNYFYINVKREKLQTQNVDGFKKYLSQNPITVQYELDTPIVRKIGLTAKGNYKEITLNGSEEVSQNPETNKMFHIYGLDLANDGQPFTLFTNKEEFTIANTRTNYTIYKYKNGSDLVITINENINTVDLFKQWLSQHPMKVGYLTNQSNTTYSNILKPIFFNDVKVQFMNDNVDIQPTLTLQTTSRNSYVMDMMKENARYTLKALANPNSFTIDGTSYGAGTNGTFTSPSTLTNKLLITGQEVQELMIIEGDVTGKQLPYYKGIRSSFDNTDEIEIYSVNKNLFDMSKVEPYDKTGINWWNTTIKENEVVSVRSGNVESGQFGAYATLDVRPNSVYTLYIEMEKDGEPFNGQIYGYENDKVWGNGTFTGYANTPYHLRTSHNAKYITIGLNYGKDFPIGTTLISKNITFYLGQESPVYIPHTHNTTIINMPTRHEVIEVLKVEIEKGSVLKSNGTLVEDETMRRPKNFIPVEPNTRLTFINENLYRAENVIFYDIDKNYMGWLYTDGSGDLVVPDNCYFIKFYSGNTNTNDLVLIKKQDKPIALNELPNGVKDEIIIKPSEHKAKLIQRVGKVIMNGYQDWKEDITDSAKQPNTSIFYSPVNTYIKPLTTDLREGALMCNKYAVIGNLYFVDKIGIMVNTDSRIYVRDNKCSLEEFKEKLKQEPIILYYELAEPIEHEILLNGYPFIYKDGSIMFNTDIKHITKVKYNVGQDGLINNQNETIIRHDKQISDLYDYIEIYLDEIYRMELFKMQLELSL